MNLIAYLDIQKKWSERVFGDGPRTEGICKHIESELKEVRANPFDVTEWIDIVLLALDGAWRAGFTPSQICKGMHDKQIENRKRKWQSGKPQEEPMFHVKDE